MTECPNCASHTAPVRVVVAGITYYNCTRCDFSTWNLNEYTKVAR